jgi:hypothetical protein
MRGWTIKTGGKEGQRYVKSPLLERVYRIEKSAEYSRQLKQEFIDSRTKAGLPDSNAAVSNSKEGVYLNWCRGLGCWVEIGPGEQSINHCCLLSRIQSF